MDHKGVSFACDNNYRQMCEIGSTLRRTAKRGEFFLTFKNVAQMRITVFFPLKEYP